MPVETFGTLRHAPTVSRGWMLLILDAAARAGVDRDAVAAAIGVGTHAFEAPRCPLPLCIATWDAAARLSGDPLFGLHAGLGLRPLHLNLLAHALQGSRTVGEVLARVQRYLPLVSDGGTLELHRGAINHNAVNHSAIRRGQLHRSGEEHLEIRYIPLSHGWQYSHHQIDAALLAVKQTLDGLLADATDGGPAPLCVTFRHRLIKPAAYRSAFACPTRGECVHDSLFYPASLLALPAGGDAVSQARAVARAERLLSGLREHTFGARCERLLAATLAQGDSTRRQIATQLSLSERTLQRRLAAEGQDFQTLLARLRQDLACEYLDAGVSAAQTGRLLGYSEAAAFHRAFVAWLGVTPGAYARRSATKRGRSAAKQTTKAEETDNGNEDLSTEA